MRLGFSFFLVVCCTAVPLGASCVNTRILASLSEQIGEVASMAAIEGMIPGAEQLPSALPGDGKQGQFDLVYRGPDGTFTIQKYSQAKWDSGSSSHKLSDAPKVTFDDGAGMVKALSGLYETSIKATLPSGPDPNFQFSFVTPGGVVVEGYVDIDPSRTPTHILRSIYVNAASF
ncbi:MAG: hypothetical protein RLZZ519_1839 [Bacteroidota bacterium]|jgi:hypothetical protein